MHTFTVESHSIQTGLLLLEHNKRLATLLKDIFCSGTCCQRQLSMAQNPVFCTCWDLRMAASISSTFCEIVSLTNLYRSLSSVIILSSPSLALHGTSSRKALPTSFRVSTKALLFFASFFSSCKKPFKVNVPTHELNTHTACTWFLFSQLPCWELKCVPGTPKG